jgi:hypothetical protein
MNAAHLLTHFDRLADAPDAIPRLRRFILDLAVQGRWNQDSRLSTTRPSGSRITDDRFLAHTSADASWNH